MDPGPPTFNRNATRPPQRPDPKAICAFLDDFVIDDLQEILMRNGLLLPTKSHW